MNWVREREKGDLSLGSMRGGGEAYQLQPWSLGEKKPEDLGERKRDEKYERKEES